MFSSSKASSNYKHPLWRKTLLNKENLFKELLNNNYFDKIETILDAGAGDLTTSKFFQEQGFSVVAIEPRIESSFENERLKVKKCSIQDFESDNKFDLVLFMNVLYHLGEPGKVLKKLANLSSKYLVVDTIVLDHDGDALVFLEEDTNPEGNSISGGACRPSKGWIINRMSEYGFKLASDLSEKVPNIPSDGESTGQCYQWDYQRTCGWRRDEMQLKGIMLFSK